MIALYLALFFLVAILVLLIFGRGKADVFMESPEWVIKRNAERWEPKNR